MDFICRWIDVTKSQSIDQDLTDEQYEVILEMYKLCDGNPVAAERTILDIVQRDPGNKVLGRLGAGLLEDLIEHFPEYLDRFIAAARSNSKIRVCLANVVLSDERVADKLKLDSFLAASE